MNSSVREPIQVYLTREERAELDLRAEGLGVSRSEVLRRGIRATARDEGTGPLGDLIRHGIVAPAKAPRGVPPRGRPVAPLREVLEELDRDREGR